MADMPPRDATDAQIAGWQLIMDTHTGWQWCDFCKEHAPCSARRYAREQLIATGRPS